MVLAPVLSESLRKNPKDFYRRDTNNEPRNNGNIQIPDFKIVLQVRVAQLVALHTSEKS